MKNQNQFVGKDAALENNRLTLRRQAKVLVRGKIFLLANVVGHASEVIMITAADGTNMDVNDINDPHGHDTSNQLLISVAARMKLALREDDTLARMGGDEFVDELVDPADAATSLPMLTRLLIAASQPEIIENSDGNPGGDRILQVSASLGVTSYPQSEVAEALIRWQHPEKGLLPVIEDQAPTEARIQRAISINHALTEIGHAQ